MVRVRHNLVVSGMYVTYMVLHGITWDVDSKLGPFCDQITTMLTIQKVVKKWLK